MTQIDKPLLVSRSATNSHLTVRQKPRVLWLANYPLLENHTGHSASWMTTLADAVCQDVALTIVSWNSSIDSDSVTEKNGITYVYLKAPRGSIDLLTGCWLKINTLVNFLTQHQTNFDLIHIHGSENQFVAACASFDIPKVLSVQGIISEYYRVIPEALSYRRAYWLLAGYYEQRYCRSVSHFMCRTHWDSAWVSRLNPQATIHPVWEMIRPEFFSINNDFSGNHNLLYVGGLQSIKGFTELLTAFDSVKSQLPATRVIVLGTKPKTLRPVERLIRKLGLRNVSISDLDFRGMQAVDGLIKAYQESFCLVHPSYIDNSPNSICEAQIAGLPVVASNVGGVASLITDQQTGLLTTLEPDHIASQILRLKTESGLARKLAERSRQVARKRHDPQQIKQDVLTTYQSVIGHQPPQVL